jgi:hypothetical protein
LLDKTKYSTAHGVSSLGAVDQAAILAFCFDVKNHNPKDGCVVLTIDHICSFCSLTTEEMFPYVERVLANEPKHWATQLVALLIKSRLECEMTRRVERSLSQLQACCLLIYVVERNSEQALADEYSSLATPVQQRLHLFHIVALPTIQQLNDELAQVLKSPASMPNTSSSGLHQPRPAARRPRHLRAI